MKSKLKPELIAALFPSTVGKATRKPPHEFVSELDRYGLSYSLSETITIPRVKLFGSNEEELKLCRAVLAASPEIEAWLILHEAVKEKNVLEAIQERASIQWEHGLSDSLYQTVLRKIKELKEEIERDAESKAIRKPPTNWKAELQKYR